MPQGQSRAQQDLRELFRSELDGLYRYAAKLLRDPEEAEDAVQDAFIRVCGQDGQSAAPSRPRPWMFRVLRNLCIDRLRSRQTLHVAFDSDLATHNGTVHRTPESELLAADTLRHVSRAFDGLPADLAETLSLVVVEGLSYQDTAFIMETPVGTVRSRLNRARRLLRQCLHPDQSEESAVRQRKRTALSAEGQ